MIVMMLLVSVRTLFVIMLGRDANISYLIRNKRKTFSIMAFESAGLEPVLNHTEKSCIASIYSLARAFTPRG